MPGTETSHDSLPTVPAPTASDIARLRHKYERLGELRGGVGVNSADQVREPLRELAKEFPGSLREIDVLSSERIQRRANELRELGADEAGGLDSVAVPEWARVTHAYHRLMRVALWLKSELGAGEGSDRELELAVQQVFGIACSLEWIARVQKPPRGRLNALVFEALAAQFGRPEAELRQLIFPRGNTSEPRTDDGAA